MWADKLEGSAGPSGGLICAQNERIIPRKTGPYVEGEIRSKGEQSCSGSGWLLADRNCEPKSEGNNLTLETRDGP